MRAAGSRLSRSHGFTSCLGEKAERGRKRSVAFYGGTPVEREHDACESSTIGPDLQRLDQLIKFKVNRQDRAARFLGVPGAKCKITTHASNGGIDAGAGRGTVMSVVSDDHHLRCFLTMAD